MIAGRLNKPIVIERSPASSPNILGEEPQTETRREYTRADVVWGAGRRDTSNLEISYPYDVTFIVWSYFHGRVEEGDIVVYLGKKYQIVSLEVVPESRMLYMKARTL